MNSTDLDNRPASRAPVRTPNNFLRHDHLVEVVAAPGPRDHWHSTRILDAIQALPGWSDRSAKKRNEGIRGARAILDWLRTRPGQGWQERWTNAGVDTEAAWLDDLIRDDDPRSATTQRDGLVAGLGGLLLSRVILPSYEFLHAFTSSQLYISVQQACRPDLFEAMRQAGQKIVSSARQLSVGLAAISKLVLHTGRDVDQLTAEDVLAYRAWRQLHRSNIDQGLALAWILLREMTNLGPHRTLKDAVRHGQRPTTELVDLYRIQCKPVRDLLIRYLDERRPALDYGTFKQLVQLLAGKFWVDLEQHHPGIDSIKLSDEVAQAWKQRMRTVARPDGTLRPRRDYFRMLIWVRCFYLDLHDWSREDPSWSQWAVPSPIRKSDTAGHRKAKAVTRAEVHQRIRERLPHLPTLVDVAERHRGDQAELLRLTRQTPVGANFCHDGRKYRRVVPKTYETNSNKGVPPDQVLDVATGKVIDVGRTEAEAFWAWAVIEVLQHTGVRIEELLEISEPFRVTFRGVV